MTGVEGYGAMLAAAGRRVEEAGSWSSLANISELELQAAWFSGQFGREFTALDGRTVSVVQFGVWNREAGPDFSDAAVSFDGGPPVRGAIEIDSSVRDWEAHGHAANADYDSVVLHAFFRNSPERMFTRTSDSRNVAQILLDSRDAGHPAAVPLASPGRCSGPLQSLPVDATKEVIRAAAQFRLRRKSGQLARAIEIHGADEALFQALAVTLGYKNNKLPFALIAQRLPLRLLRRSSGDCAALLFGVAGFLNEADLLRFDPKTRAYVRELWESWWAKRAECGRLVLSPTAWKLSGMRPVNHPQRRLAALAQVVMHWPTLRVLAQRCDSTGIRRFFSGLHDEYWDRHWTVRSSLSSRPMALVGKTRITEMLANVFFPFAYGSVPDLWDAYCRLPAVLGNRKVETAASRLLGGSPVRKEILKSVAYQQGLLQIYEDFCMRDATDCVRCAFPEQLNQFV